MEFMAILKPVEGMQAMYIDFPYDVFEVFGVRGQVKVKATFDGVPYRGSLAKMGGDCHILIVRKDIRAKIGKNPGDAVTVTVERDTEERIVEVPADFSAALAETPAAAARFEKLSYTHRREYVQWITEAKKPETRERRIGKAIEMLLENKRL
jgi:hypothetical protein